MTTLKAKIYTLVKALVGTESLIWGDQNAPRPALPYWTMILQSIRKVGEDTYSQGVTDEGVQTVTGTRDATLAVQRYGTGSDIACADLRDKIALISVIESWIAAGVVVYDETPIMNATVKLDNAQLEPRAAIDLMIRFGVDTDDIVGAIETVETEAEYPDAASAEDIDTVVVGPIL